VAIDFSRLRRTLSTQRKSSAEAQGAAKKKMRKGAAEPIFSWVLFVRTETPCLRPKRYAELRSQSPTAAGGWRVFICHLLPLRITNSKSKRQEVKSQEAAKARSKPNPGWLRAKGEGRVI
jgi:hypothetical protein